MSTSPSPRLFQHMTVVAEVASFLAYRAMQAGVVVDRRMVEAAALLHDVDKALPREHPMRALGHGAAGAAWVSQAGHAELARTLTAHPVMRLNDASAADWVANAPIEERIVTYADKRATQRVVSLEQRFERWERRHPEYRHQLLKAMQMARRLEQGICETVGVVPTEVERLRSVEDARARAESNGTLRPREADSAAEEFESVPAPLDPTAAT
jgi:putative nucleotidyltransferase with HDIG domain